MKTQYIIVLSAVLAILSKDVMCDKVEEKEAVTNEVVADSVSSPPITVAVAAVSTESALQSSIVSSLPIAPAISTAAIPTPSAIPSASVDIASAPSSLLSSVPSWPASAASVPPSTFVSSPKAAPTTVARPYAGPSVISSSNHLEMSIGIAAIGALAFILTLG